MLTTRYIEDDLKIFMNRKCNNSFVILCVRRENEKDRTAMLIDWEQALKLITEWTGLILSRDHFEEDHYKYKTDPMEVKVHDYAKPTEQTESLFRDG